MSGARGAERTVGGADFPLPGANENFSTRLYTTLLTLVLRSAMMRLSTVEPGGPESGTSDQHAAPRFPVDGVTMKKQSPIELPIGHIWTLNDESREQLSDHFQFLVRLLVFATIFSAIAGVAVLLHWVLAV